MKGIINYDMFLFWTCVCLLTLTTAVYRVPIVPTITKEPQVGIPVAEKFKRQDSCQQKKNDK